MPTHDTGNQPKQTTESSRPQSSGQLPAAPEGTLGQRGRVAPHLLTPRDVLHLQRTMGNRAVAQLLGRQSPVVQSSTAPSKPIEMPSQHFAEELTTPESSAPISGGIIQRKIDQTFTQTGQQPDKTTVGDFYKNIVIPEFKLAKEAAKKPHLSALGSGLTTAQTDFVEAAKKAIGSDQAQDWQLAVQELDKLVGVVNHVNKESNRPTEWIAEGDEKYPVPKQVPIPGPMSEEGVLDNWGYDVQDLLNPKDYISFYHATTAKGKIEGKQIVIMEGSKEFGAGFYTTATDIETPAKKIGDEWFTKKQQDPAWSIIRFSIPKNHTAFLQSKDPALNIFLEYILTHTSGYPSGGAAPDVTDMQNINAINLEGRVLIFPDNKSTKVQTILGEKSWEDYTAHKLGGGDYELVIGPQQPTYMGNWRQYAFTGSRAIWMINTARRFVAYENKKH